MKLKSIDIQAKEWFDRANGNSYYSVRITINYGYKNQTELSIPFSYGYGDQYIYESKSLLIREGYFDKLQEKYSLENYSLYSLCLLGKIKSRYSKIEKCNKKEVKFWGELSDVKV